MPRVIENRERMIDAFRDVDIVSELVTQLPNGEFENELDMDIILFGRSYRGKQVGPYARLLEFDPGETIVEENTWESSRFYILVAGELDAIVSKGGSQRVVGSISQGSSFGEMALLSGTPRTASVVVRQGSANALVLEFTRPAIRLLRKLPKFGRALDRNYRGYGLSLAVNELRDFTSSDLSPALLERLGDASRFAVYDKGQVLFREGDPINRVYYVRTGWIQRVSGVKFNPQAADLLLETDPNVKLDFAGPGSCFGIDAIDADGKWGFTASVRGRSEVVEIAANRLRDDRELAGAVLPFLKRAASDAKPTPDRPVDLRAIAATTKEIETGVVDGVNLLVMDMAKCIRCGNCSFACHQMHGNSRLVRRGIHIERPKKPKARSLQSLLVPTVCMHCEDAECLTGCPTGAIARNPSGEIDINLTTCIGCGDCATQCPYDAISMIPRHHNEGRSVLSRFAGVFSLRSGKIPAVVTATEDLVAVKCNLCKGTPLNPAGAKTEAYSCEESCPTGALVRVEPREYFDEIAGTMGAIRLSNTHAIGVNIHRRDPWAIVWNFIGTLLVIAGSVAALIFTMRFTQDEPLQDGTWLTMRWLTGFVGLAAIVWVMAYPIRKQIYRRRRGALRYWLQSHIYIGVLSGAVLLVHGGTSSGGLLTTLLMISFDLVIITGMIGAILYWFVPRLMTRIEREPLLVEDLETRRDELLAELSLAAEQAPSDRFREIVDRRVRRRFMGVVYLMKQVFGGRDLNAMLADARAEFNDIADEMPRFEYVRLMDAVENAATLRRVEALIYLHRSLKVWLPPHVLFTSIMIVLMFVHIFQVMFFSVR